MNVRRLVVMVGVLLTGGVPLGAQQVVYGDTIVEIAGLRTWSVEAIESAVQRYQPGLSLASAACAVILRDSVGFADAAVTVYHDQDQVWVMLRVVEPSDSALVQYRDPDRGAVPMPGEWGALGEAVAESSPEAVNALQFPGVLLDGQPQFPGLDVPEPTLELLDQIWRYQDEGDRRVATEIIRESDDPEAREIAALILSNFPERDDTWHALVEGLLAGTDRGATMARMVVQSLAWTGAFMVDWGPARETLEALMGGTNLFAYPTILQVLVQTGMDRPLARDLASRNSELLVDHALAANPIASGGARQFLTRAGAPDFGNDREAWLTWTRQ